MTIVFIVLLVVCWALLGAGEQRTHPAGNLLRYQRRMLRNHD